MSVSASSPRPSWPSPTHGDDGARVLVLLCHPMLHKSRVNRTLSTAVRGLPGVTVHDLYEACPDFHIDVAREQALLLRHDVIVWQHPFYWYSVPALLKEWMDQVLQYRWAYGPGGEALRGKTLLDVTSTGGPEASYQPGGLNGVPVPTLLAPLAQTAKLCGMTWLPPLVIHGANRLDAHGLGQVAASYRSVLTALKAGNLQPHALADGRLDLAATLAAVRA